MVQVARDFKAPAWLWASCESKPSCQCRATVGENIRSLNLPFVVQQMLEAVWCNLQAAVLNTQAHDTMIEDNSPMPETANAQASYFLLMQNSKTSTGSTFGTSSSVQTISVLRHRQSTLPRDMCYNQPAKRKTNTAQISDRDIVLTQQHTEIEIVLLEKTCVCKIREDNIVIAPDELQSLFPGQRFDL